jgi:hypothetical protein
VFYPPEVCNDFEASVRYDPAKNVAGGEMLHRFILAACLMTCLGSFADAQSTEATITGTISDPTGAVLPGVSVSAINEGDCTDAIRNN